jgi:hypothetical protein
MCAKVIATTQQRPVTARAFASMANVCPGIVLLKFTMSEDRQATLQGHKPHCKGQAALQGHKPHCKGQAALQGTSHIAKAQAALQGTSRTTRARGPYGDQVGLRGGPHAHTSGAQVEAVAAIQGGQGGMQAHLLAHSQALRQRHLELPALLYLGAQGQEKPMRGIMEHARGWCK